jgi:ubiquinone/menaquinone biosynthesis C-methylase UbiE
MRLPPAAYGPTVVFGPLAEDYARFRPSYPAPLFDALAERLGGHPGLALDLGSGTGAALLPLLERGMRVVAVEPNGAMLSRARSRLGDRPGWVGAVMARAESLPIASGVASCVTVAQAFHWFEAETALAEIARVLRPRGVLALLWNVTVSDAFTDDVHELIVRHNPGYGHPVTRSMLATPDSLARHPSFVVEQPAQFDHQRPMTEDAYVGYAFSWSYCGGALTPEQRLPFERELRQVIRRHHPDGTWVERLTAVAHFATRAADRLPSVAGE